MRSRQASARGGDYMHSQINLLLNRSSQQSARDHGFMSRTLQLPWRFLIPAAAAFVGFVSLQYSAPLIDYQLNADSMYIFMITNDIVFDGGHLADWFTLVHLFIYPDILLAIPILLMQKLGLPIFIGCITTYGLMLMFLITYAWHKITGELLVRSLLAGSILLGILFCGDYLVYRLVSLQEQAPDLSRAGKSTEVGGRW